MATKPAVTKVTFSLKPEPLYFPYKISIISLLAKSEISMPLISLVDFTSLCQTWSEDRQNLLIKDNYSLYNYILKTAFGVVKKLLAMKNYGS